MDPIVPPVDRGTVLRSPLSLTALLVVADVGALGMGGLLGAWWGGLRAAAFIVTLTLLIQLARYRYRWRFTLSVLDELPALVGTIGAATLIAAAGFAVTLTTVSRFPETRIMGTLEAGLAILLACVIGRALAFALVRDRRRRGVGVARATIVGSGDTAHRLGSALESDPTFGVHLVGYVDDVPAPNDGRRLLGTLESLPNVVRDQRIDLVLIAYGSRKCQSVVDPVRALGSARCEIFIVPRLYELHDGAAAGDIVGGLPLIQLRRLAFRSPSWRVKRAMDIAVAALGLVITAPLMLALSGAVRLETGPGVIFKQQRIGRDGLPFTLYKFRSLKPAEGEDKTRWNIDGDPRLGPVGVLIRSTSLDELPQLVNILRGHMSLVGPRPERPFFVEEFSATIPGYRYRHRMPVGLTGLAVVHGLRGDTDIKGRANFDNLYAESWSLWLDVKIMLRTASQLVPRFRVWRIRMPRRGSAADPRAPTASPAVPSPPTRPRSARWRRSPRVPARPGGSLCSPPAATAATPAPAPTTSQWPETPPRPPAGSY